MESQAQPYADLVWQQLQAVNGIAEQEGYVSQNYIIGKLSQGQTDNWTMTLYGGYSYVIMGACDGDCQDVDIRLFDEYGNEIASDVSEDDIPTLEGVVEETAQYTIQVDMYACSNEPCYFGLGIFHQ